MADRFQKLFSLENNLYIENAPIIISAAALLKDTKSGNIVVQVKFKSVSNKNIKGVKISLSAYDVSGKEINGADDYQYLDLNIPNGQSFGSSKAIVMPETTTRSFTIKSLTVIFADSSIWENASPDFVTIPNAKPLNSELKSEELIKQYQIATTSKANNIPNTFLNLWTCCCGEVNSEEYCTNCGTNKNNTFFKYNIIDLTEAMKLRLDKEKQLELERQEKLIVLEKENKLKKKQIIKKCMLGTTICIVIVLLLFAVKLFFGNMINYNIAISAMEKGEYDKAIEIFTNLKDYKDSTDKLTETKYLLAEYYVSSEKYKEAYKGFLELKDYKDSAKKSEEYKTGEFSETVSIRVGCNLDSPSEYYSPRSESDFVEVEMKIKYHKGLPDYNNVEIIFETHEYQGNYSGKWGTASYKYIGEFKNNSITGKGKLYTYNEYYPDDSRLVYDGEFLNGMYNGEGSLYDYDLNWVNKLSVKGEWKNGNIEGKFTSYYDDGTIADTGTVKNGIRNSNKYSDWDRRFEYAPKPDGFDS